MIKKFIVIFKSIGNFKNNELDSLLNKTIYNVISLPILKVVNIHCDPISTNGSQAILITSANGLYRLSELSYDRTTKLFAVGKTTKKLAKKLGYKNVIDCEGDSGKMFNMVLKQTCKELGHLIYVGAKDISLDIPKMLKEVGYKVKRFVVYKTNNVDVIDSKFVNLLKLNKIKWIVLLSEKGAYNFNRLVEKDINLKYFLNVKFACLSKKVANKLSRRIISKFYPSNPSLDELKYIIMKNE